MNEIPELIPIPASTKGPSFIDAGYIYSPYVPVYKTQIVLDPNSFSPAKGIIARYGKKLLQQGAKYYGNVSLGGDEPCEMPKIGGEKSKDKHRSITEDWEVSKLD